MNRARLLLATISAEGRHTIGLLDSIRIWGWVRQGAHAIIYNPRAIRTVVVLALAWAIALGFGEQRALHTLSRRSLVFLGLSAIATAVSWLAYYRALQLPAASHVAPIDKMSLPLTLVLAALFLGEEMTWRLVLGVALMTVGSLITLK